MLKALTILALLAMPTLAHAKTPDDKAPEKIFKLGDPPAAEIKIPGGWEADASEGALEATTSDKTAYLSADIFDASELDEIRKATTRFLLDQKITIDPKSKAQKEVQIAGLKAVEISLAGTDEGGPTRFRIWIVKLPANRLALLLYWRSEAGETAHGAEVEAITGSLKPIR